MNVLEALNSDHAACLVCGLVHVTYRTTDVLCQNCHQFLTTSSLEIHCSGKSRTLLTEVTPTFPGVICSLLLFTNKEVQCGTRSVPTKFPPVSNQRLLQSVQDGPRKHSHLVSPTCRKVVPNFLAGSPMSKECVTISTIEHVHLYRLSLPCSASTTAIS